jgi:diguanylate cyclase (GGDEF)-like protein
MLSPNSPGILGRLTFVSAVGFVSALAILLGFAFWAAHNVDEDAQRTEASFVVSGLASILDRVSTEQESITIWDDAVIKAREGDQLWMTENIGQWVGDYFGHDEVYVLDQHNQPVHAMRDGQTVDNGVFGERAGLILPLTVQLRREIGSAADDAAIGEMGAADTFLEDDVPVRVSVKPIVPFGTTLTVDRGQEYVHVSFRRVDQDVLAEIERTYRISGLEFSAEETNSGPVVPVASNSGRTLSVLTWTPNRPGAKLITQAVPGTIAAATVGGALLVFLLMRLRRSATNLIASEAQTRFLAFHDTLTGLPNRALFEDRLDRALVSARETGTNVALHLVDVDRFKYINGTLGHAAGDAVIRQVGLRLAGAIKTSDTVARLGGDEFAIVQTGIKSIADAEKSAERLIERISAPMDVTGTKLNVTGSLGLVVTLGAEHTREEMLRKADIALYEAKGRGRARFTLFDADMDDVVKRRRLIEDELRLALELGSQIKLVYQPIFASDGKRIVGAEALVRWDHPVHGRMAPELFISIAEERGLISQLGEHVLREAAEFGCRSNVPWIAVNVSPLQFRDAQFAVTVLNQIAEAGLPASRLQLEITEGVLLENAVLVESTLTRLRRAGVRVALDDFGTGYSSMNYLRRYSIDKLKIDQSFIAELGTSAEADAIVRSMITLARSLRLEVTAEGVETKEQMHHLAALGCHEMQGFLLSRPISEEQLTELMDQPEAYPQLLRSA